MWNKRRGEKEKQRRNLRHKKTLCDVKNDDGIFAKYPIQTCFRHFYHYQSVASSIFLVQQTYIIEHRTRKINNEDMCTIQHSVMLAG